MIKRLRIRMAAVCTLATVFVLVAMAGVSLHYTERQFRMQAEAAFATNLNTVFYYLRGQAVVDQGWLMQTQASEGIYIRIEDGGRPLLYITQKPEQDALTARALVIAQEEHGFDNTLGSGRKSATYSELETEAGDLAQIVEVSIVSGFDNAVEQAPQERALTVLASKTALEQYNFDSTIGIPGSLEPKTIQFEMVADGARYRAAVSAVPISGGWVGVTILKPMDVEEKQVLQLRLIFGGSVVLASLLLFAFAWFFTGRAVKPVEQSRRKQAEFISAASHELRSPLAVMQASADAMQAAPLEKARSFAKNIEGECKRLSGLAGDLLSLAGADAGRWSIEKELAEPETILLSATERFELLAAQKGLSLCAKLPEETSLPRCRCDPGRIAQVLTILVDNAVSYTPSGGAIQLEAGVTGKKQIWFSVSDNGPGIPNNMKKQIFQRFYRVDKARTAREHYGLGLSIANEITVLHKGSLTVRDTPGGGATFVLSIPISG